MEYKFNLNDFLEELRTTLSDAGDFDDIDLDTFLVDESNVPLLLEEVARIAKIVLDKETDDFDESMLDSDDGFYFVGDDEPLD